MPLLFEKRENNKLNYYIYMYVTYVVFPSSATAELPTVDLTITQFQKLTLTPPINPMPKYLGKIDFFGY